MTKAPRRGAAGIAWTVALDALFVAAGMGAMGLALVRGRARGAFDHVRRRALEAPPVRAGSARCVWIHGVSVGEVLTARSLGAGLAQHLADWEVAVSASTRAGFECAALHFPGRMVFSTPLDLSGLVRRAFAHVRPDLLVIIEHDLWPNLLAEARRRGVPVALVNARLSPRSRRGYRRLSKLCRGPFASLGAICAQDQATRDGFVALGVTPESVHVTGNLKFDNPPPPAAGLRQEMDFRGDDWVFLAGSTHEGEEAAALDAFVAARSGPGEAFAILVPRRPERGRAVLDLVRARGLSAALWSERKTRGPDVLVVDTVGELARLSAAADAVFVGGSLVPIGGHNVIEPAAHGRAVVIGPHYHNFRGIVASFLERHALVVVEDAAGLTRELAALRRDPGRARELGARARATVTENLGAAERTIAVLVRLAATHGVGASGAPAACGAS